MSEVRRRKAKKGSGEIIPSRKLQASSKSKNTQVSKITLGSKAPIFGKFNMRTANFGGGGADIAQSGNLPFYSPQLSTDYFQLPRSNQERREWYRHFYENDELVARAIDLHCDLPLSKVTLAKPHCADPEMSTYIWKFFSGMLDRLNFFTRLEEIAHEYWLMGNAFIFAEEDSRGLGDDIYYPDPQMEEGEDDSDEDDTYQDFLHDSDEDYLEDELVDNFQEVEEQVEEFLEDQIKETLLTEEQKQKKQHAENKYQKWGFKNPQYRGWKRLIVLPPEQVVIESFDFSDQIKIYLTPSESMRKMLEGEYLGDPNYKNIMDDVPLEIVQKMGGSDTIPLDTNPYTGSHCYHMTKRKSQYEDFGLSILQRCMRTLLYRDKLRQYQTMIADRNMTPKHLVWAETLSDFQVEELREQVDLAMVDPDYAIVTNYQINWDVVSNSDRLLDLSSEYEEAQNRLLMGLGVTKEVLTGEGTYGGNRITLEIMNTQYLLFREKIQNWVEEYLFKPVALKKGFVEIDPIDGEVRPIIPKLKFTRLAVRDNSDTYEQLFTLYQKGSLPVDYILEMFNIDSHDAKEKLKQDLFTVNDSRFNDMLTSIYQNVSSNIIDGSDVVENLIENLGLEKVEAPDAEEGGDEGLSRFSSLKQASSDEKDEFIQFMNWLYKKYKDSRVPKEEDSSESTE